jgi:hypothetical protein
VSAALRFAHAYTEDFGRFLLSFQIVCTICAITAVEMKLQTLAKLNGNIEGTFWKRIHRNKNIIT